MSEIDSYRRDHLAVKISFPDCASVEILFPRMRHDGKFPPTRIIMDQVHRTLNFLEGVQSSHDMK